MDTATTYAVEQWVVDLVGDRIPYSVYIDDSWNSEDGDRLLGFDEDGRYPTELGSANCISSRLPNGDHRPVLDIDRPYTAAEELLIREALMLPADAVLVSIGSSTEGHCHLYVQHDVDDWQLNIGLMRLAAVDIIGPGFAIASIRRRATFVRLPWAKKQS